MWFSPDLAYKLIFSFVTFAVAYIIAAILSNLIRKYREINTSFRPISGIVIFFINLICYLVALLLALDNFGIQIGSLVASLGITGLAVSLALVDVLKDFFAGIYILADRTVSVGNFVQLSSGESGEVVEIGWRSVKLRKDSGEIIVIPNQKFYQASITIK